MSFFVAWGLLTSIPLRRNALDTQQPGRSAAWFPLIGLVVGGMLFILNFLFTRLMPDLLSAALLLVAWVAVSGGLHLDGFVDCCDGLLVAKPAERRLEIMKDSRVGAFGLVGAICLLLVKFAVLTTLPATGGTIGLVLVPVLSRWAMVWVAWRYPLARQDGSAAWFRRGLGRRQVALAGVSALLIAVAVGGWVGLTTFAAVWLFAFLFAAWALRRIPGLTGDVYGALNELAEVVGLLWVIVVGGYGV